MLVIYFLFLICGLIFSFKPEILVQGTIRYFKSAYEFFENNKPLVKIFCRLYGIILFFAGILLIIKNN